MVQPIPAKGTRYFALLIDESNQPDWYDITLNSVFNKGGAAELWTVDTDNANFTILAKLWNDEVLAGIAAHPPEAGRLIPLIRHRDELYAKLRFVVWPRRILFTRPELDNSVADIRGFTMSKLSGYRKLFAVLDAAQEGETPLKLHEAAYLAEALCGNVQRLHAHPWQFRFGDLTPNNILVDAQLTDLYFVDADSFQFTYNDPFTGAAQQIAINGLTPGYTSPEAIAANKRRQRGAFLPPLSEDHDNFILAILIYQILMSHFGLGGTHPFQGSNEDLLDTYIENRQFAPELPDPPINDYIVAQYKRIPENIRSAFRHTFIDQKPLKPAEWKRLISDSWRSLPPG